MNNLIDVPHDKVDLLLKSANVSETGIKGLELRGVSPEHTKQREQDGLNVMELPARASLQSLSVKTP